MSPLELKAWVEKQAEINGLDPNLISAVIWQESRGRRNATRYEKGFHRKYLLPKPYKKLPGYVPLMYGRSEDTEVKDRATSFGLMQIMGQTAREYKFKANELTELLDPMINIELGSRILADKIRRNGGDVIKGLLAWNGGSNKNYPTEVMQWLENGAYSSLYVQ